MGERVHQEDPAKLHVTCTPVGAITVAEPVSVDDNGGSLTVDGTVTIQKPLSVDDNGGSLTVDGAVTATIQEPLSVDDNGSSLTVDTTGTTGLEIVQTTAADLNCTEASAASILTAVQKLDNCEDPVTYYTVQKTGTDGDIIATPGAGHHLRIHHIYVVNCDTTDTEFYIRNGSAGTPYFPYYLAAYGGAVAQNLKRPWDLSTNTALYYDFISGTTPDCFITVGYEDITE